MSNDVAGVCNGRLRRWECSGGLEMVWAPEWRVGTRNILAWTSLLSVQPQLQLPESPATVKGMRGAQASRQLSSSRQVLALQHALAQKRTWIPDTRSLEVTLFRAPRLDLASPYCTSSHPAICDKLTRLLSRQIGPGISRD